MRETQCTFIPKLTNDLFGTLYKAFRGAGVCGPILGNINGDMRSAFTVYDSEGWGVFRIADDGDKLEVIPEY